MDQLIIAGRAFQSRLMVGTGKFASNQAMVAAMEGSGCQIVTVALRRVDIDNPADDLLNHIDRQRYLLLPNTSGARDAEEAVRLARLARAAGCEPWVKLEVTPDPYYLLPDPIETLKAAEVLIRDGFDVMVYTNDDPIVARELENIGCIAVMPLAAPIGSGLGIRNKLNIRTIVENAKVPILVDAGVGTASDAAEAMELGCDGVLMNTAIAAAQNPILMASAMRKAIEAGREAYLAGRMPARRFASASSPIEGMFF